MRLRTALVCGMAVLCAALGKGQQPAATASPQIAETAPKSSAGLKGAGRNAISPNALPDPGTLQNGIYRNATYHFSYKLPFGWVDRTATMQQHEEPGSSPEADPGKAMVLLAAFERPPEAKGETINSAIVIAAESASSYPGLKTAADYFGPLTELTAGKGFKVDNEPYAVTINAKPLVRADFSKPLSDLTMHQSSLAMLEKGYIVSFTFLAGSEDEIENLTAGLTFTGVKPRANPVKK